MTSLSSVLSVFLQAAPAQARHRAGQRSRSMPSPGIEEEVFITDPGPLAYLKPVAVIEQNKRISFIGRIYAIEQTD